MLRKNPKGKGFSSVGTICVRLEKENRKAIAADIKNKKFKGIGQCVNTRLREAYALPAEAAE